MIVTDSIPEDLGTYSPLSAQPRMEPLWKECLWWLDQFKVVPPGHPSLAAAAGPHDLALLLRDGVVLCQLVHCLDPQSVDMTQVRG